MKTSTLLAAVAATLCASSFAQAESIPQPRLFAATPTATFNEANRYLTLPTLQIGTQTFTDVVFRIDGGALISVGATPPVVVPVVAETCTVANFTSATFNAVKVGMSFSQVQSAIGCKNNAGMTQRTAANTIYNWGASYATYMIVWFDASGSTVTPAQDDPALFKHSQGF